ncbi:MAG: hypothetical protein HZA80_01715 [Candidatus Taylorbacteria bacterium]|nr:hypothetical protein [Candidatus Taylorbacteria bacterium]
MTPQKLLITLCVLGAAIITVMVVTPKRQVVAGQPAVTETNIINLKAHATVSFGTPTTNNINK